MSDTLTAVQYGVGPIGARIVRAAVRRGYEFVGAVDVDPAKVGSDLGVVADVGRPLGVTVTDDPDVALDGDEVDVVFLATASALEAVFPQLRTCLERGIDVVSTCEQLTYPWYRHPDLAAELDALATDHGATVLGTGINPGFAMDFLPAVLTTPCHDVASVEVVRVQDAATRREPLQRKVGAGLTVEAFEREIRGQEGHVGLTESVAMLAATLGWELSDVTESAEPVVADEPVETAHVSVAPGEVAGTAQRGVGRVDGEVRIELEISQYVGAANPRDETHVAGDPDLEISIPGGIHGDTATPAIVVNRTPHVVDGDPGLATMIDGVER